MDIFSNYLVERKYVDIFAGYLRKYRYFMYLLNVSIKKINNYRYRYLLIIYNKYGSHINM